MPGRRGLKSLRRKEELRKLPSTISFSSLLKMLIKITQALYVDFHLPASAHS
jgi:hypothetical protein